MNTLQLDEVILISLAIKIVVGAVLSIIETFLGHKIEKIEKPVLVLLLLFVSVVIMLSAHIDYQSALNIFFYTLGIDNISEYSKKSIYEIKEKINSNAK